MQLAAPPLLLLLLLAAVRRTSVAAGGSLHFRSAPGGAGPDLSTVDAVRTGSSGRIVFLSPWLHNMPLSCESLLLLFCHPC